jgi:hypothetical protein
MPNDAKIGLICGLGIVVAVAIAFFRSDGPGASVRRETTVAVGASKLARAPAPPSNNRPVKPKPQADSRAAVPVLPAGRSALPLESKPNTTPKGHTSPNEAERSNSDEEIPD